MRCPASTVWICGTSDWCEGLHIPTNKKLEEDLDITRFIRWSLKHVNTICWSGAEKYGSKWAPCRINLWDIFLIGKYHKLEISSGTRWLKQLFFTTWVLEATIPEFRILLYSFGGMSEKHCVGLPWMPSSPNAHLWAVPIISYRFQQLTTCWQYCISKHGSQFSSWSLGIVGYPVTVAVFTPDVLTSYRAWLNSAWNTKASQVCRSP